MFNRIGKHTKEEELKKAIGAGNRPTLIATGGQPLHIRDVPQFWPQGDRVFYSDNHPIVVVFGVSRSQDRELEKGYRACTLKDIDDWLREEKENRKFYIGTLMIGVLSLGLIVARLAVHPEA